MIEDIKSVYLGGGDPPPKGGFKKLYNTPLGVYPKLGDVALKYGMLIPSVHRRFSNKNYEFKEWHVIWKPTKHQIDQAIENANTLHISINLVEDNCKLCHNIDNLLFSERCWLLNVEHKHSLNGTLYTHGTLDDPGKAVIYYSYRKETYRVTYRGWLLGERPHLNTEDI